MAEGWVLVVGVTALFLTITLVAFVLRAVRGSRGAQEGLLALGPALVTLGIIFGQDPLIGYTLIGAGVVVSVLLTVVRRSSAV